MQVWITLRIFKHLSKWSRFFFFTEKKMVKKRLHPWSHFVVHNSAQHVALFWWNPLKDIQASQQVEPFFFSLKKMVTKRLHPWSHFVVHNSASHVALFCARLSKVELYLMFSKAVPSLASLYLGRRWTVSADYVCQNRFCSRNPNRSPD